MSKKFWHILSLVSLIGGGALSILGGIAGSKENAMQISEDVDKAYDEKNKVEE